MVALFACLFVILSILAFLNLPTLTYKSKSLSSKLHCIMASASDNSTPPVASEDEVGEKWDRCIADTLLKTGEHCQQAV